MADDVVLNPGTGGDTIAADDVGGIKFQRVKLTLGGEGVNAGDVSTANPVPVSAASLPLPAGAATSANQSTANASLASIDGKTPDEFGAWGYNAGTAGTLNVAANKRVLAITATSPSLTAASMTINGGQTVTIPAGSSITVTPRANLVAPTIVFSGTGAYFVEFVE